MMDSYYTKKAQWQRKQSTDEVYGRPVSYPSVEISIREERTRRQVKDKRGERVTSESTVFTSAPVEAGDSIVFDDGRKSEVISVSPQEGLDGKETHREVYL